MSLGSGWRRVRTGRRGGRVMGWGKEASCSGLLSWEYCIVHCFASGLLRKCSKYGSSKLLYSILNEAFPVLVSAHR